MNLVIVVQLCNKQLGINMNMKMMDVKLDGIDEKSNHDIILILITSGATNTNNTNMED